MNQASLRTDGREALHRGVKKTARSKSNQCHRFIAQSRPRRRGAGRMLVSVDDSLSMLRGSGRDLRSPANASRLPVSAPSETEVFVRQAVRGAGSGEDRAVEHAGSSSGLPDDRRGNTIRGPVRRERGRLRRYEAEKHHPRAGSSVQPGGRRCRSKVVEAEALAMPPRYSGSWCSGRLLSSWWMGMVNGRSVTSPPAAARAAALRHGAFPRISLLNSSVKPGN